ncbi:hypothetical protein Cni_G02213 [Canna indica]|uniref:Cell wall hydroxyproline-rich glycoprotein n=1 Tax=Canna indica TaxID=4628 RepID=A0AAQ3JS32_9LILI|nr:hypothetical protein Cni_G02213 [Canna indica]
MATSNHQVFFVFFCFFLSPYFLVPSTAMFSAIAELINYRTVNWTLGPPFNSYYTPSPQPGVSSPIVEDVVPSDISGNINTSDVNTNTTDQRSNMSTSSHDEYEIPKVSLYIPNPLLKRAHTALHAWKKTIFSDPNNFTGNWVGGNVCAYNGIVCAPSLDDPAQHAVAGIDFNGADIAGHLPVELSHFKEVAFIHVNSNRFQGKIPQNLSSLVHLEELDFSNNGFVGPFPREVLKLPNLRYLDLRFNNFEGPIPPEIFDKDFDALFLNNNQFNATLPNNMGNSNASVIVLANNNFKGQIPKSVGKMGITLNEIILTGNKFSGCLPREIGLLGNVTVMDLSFNSFGGTLPKRMITGLQNVELLNLSYNELTGIVTKSICCLKHLANFTYSSNYFIGEVLKCSKKSDAVFDGKDNCMVGQGQRTTAECALVAKHQLSCGRKKIKSSLSPSIDRLVRPPPLPLENLPPVNGFDYASPPPPMFDGY